MDDLEKARIAKLKKLSDPCCPSCGTVFGPQDPGEEDCYRCQQIAERRSHAWISFFPINDTERSIQERADFADAALAEYDARFPKRRK